MGKRFINRDFQSRNPWRSTSIVQGRNACDAAKAIGDKRFLVADRITPLLPLADCDAPVCNCKYTHHHQDRRENEQGRRHPGAVKSEQYKNTALTNQRHKKSGRRKSDNDSASANRWASKRWKHPLLERNPKT